MNGTYSDTQRSYLDKEFQGLTDQIDRISKDTMWNDQKLLAGGGHLATAYGDTYTVSGLAGTLRASGTFVLPVYSGLTSVPTLYQTAAVAVYSSTSTFTAPVLVGYFVPTAKLHASFTVQAGKDEDQTITIDIGPMNIGGYGLSGLGIATFDTATSTLSKISTALEQINNQRAGIGAAINQMAFGADNLTNISSNATQSRSTIMDTDYALATTQLAKTQIIQQAATAMLAQANQQPQSVMALLKG
jgi:flagellin-like hook-associated protein FlgL